VAVVILAAILNKIKKKKKKDEATDVARGWLAGICRVGFCYQGSGTL
jgi:hypothetical protein